MKAQRSAEKLLAAACSARLSELGAAYGRAKITHKPVKLSALALLVARMLKKAAGPVSRVVLARLAKVNLSAVAEGLLELEEAGKVRPSWTGRHRVYVIDKGATKRIRAPSTP
jgi:hypothetical protein